MHFCTSNNIQELIDQTQKLFHQIKDYNIYYVFKWGFFKYLFPI